ncbi:hypothetical protein BJY52DRAFT_1276966 [Lactarius psammicola]|nr:hypothetical protein BJY52DRAFT_1276966 [Lactarius psammicola]
MSVLFHIRVAHLAHLRVNGVWGGAKEGTYLATLRLRAPFAINGGGRLSPRSCASTGLTTPRATPHSRAPFAHKGGREVQGISCSHVDGKRGEGQKEGTYLPCHTFCGKWRWEGQRGPHPLAARFPVRVPLFPCVQIVLRGDGTLSRGDGGGEVALMMVGSFCAKPRTCMPVRSCSFGHLGHLGLRNQPWYDECARGCPSRPFQARF